MTASKSMPSLAPVPETEEPSRSREKAELIERLATEMRVKSGGELPHSFCVAQVKRQLGSKSIASSAAGKPVLPVDKNGLAGRSVFHAWAMPE
jgi:hypothetical protein